MKQIFNEYGWLYKYEETAEYKKYNYVVTGVRYILGKLIDPERKKALICIGINPSTAVPELLDQTLLRVKKYAESDERHNEKYGAWYMLNVYPQRATNPKEMHEKPNEIWHENNLAAIKDLLSEVKDADVWCAWGDIIDDKNRGFLKTYLKGILDLFKGKNFQFKVFGFTKEGNPLHPLAKPKSKQLSNMPDDKLNELTAATNGLK